MSGAPTIGVINIESTDVDAYSEDDQRLMEIVAAQISVAIQKSQLLTELRAHAEELEARVAERTAKLQDTNEQLQAFASSVSHDIRAPLRAMRGMAAALIEDHAGEMAPEARQLADRIVGAGARMDRFISDLLAYSRLSRDEIKLGSVDLDRVVRTAINQLAATVQESHASITIEGTLPAARGNRTVVLQVVVNLVSNALKFVEPGTRPEIHIHAAEGSGERIRLIVDDNGIGVDEEHRDRVFLMFERLHGGETYPGTGIGLAVVKKGMDRLGGRAGVRQPILDRAGEGEGSAMTDRSAPVLVAEDDANDVLLLRRACRKARLINPLQVVTDGDDAIAYLRGDGEYADRDRYPLPVLLLLDLKMPRRSGFEVLEWLKAESPLKRLPVVVFTSSRESVDVQRAYDLGANSYLVKPGSPDDLIRMVQSLDLYWMIYNEPPDVDA